MRSPASRICSRRVTIWPCCWPPKKAARPKRSNYFAQIFRTCRRSFNLAELLASTGDKAGAIEQYRNILVQQPGYIAARLALVRLLDPEGAVEQLRIVVQADPQNVPALEQMGDLESARGHATEARAAYTQAQAAASDRADKKRIAGKLKMLNP